jgi:hypothetical protein
MKRISQPPPSDLKTAHILTSALDSNKPVGLLDAGNDSRDIKRPDTPKVDHLRLDPFLLFENLCSVQARRHTDRVRDNRDVLSRALNLGIADSQRKVVRENLRGDGEGLAIEDFAADQ